MESIVFKTVYRYYAEDNDQPLTFSVNRILEKSLGKSRLHGGVYTIPFDEHRTLYNWAFTLKNEMEGTYKDGLKAAEGKTQEIFRNIAYLFTCLLCEYLKGEMEQADGAGRGAVLSLKETFLRYIETEGVAVGGGTRRWKELVPETDVLNHLMNAHDIDEAEARKEVEAIYKPSSLRMKFADSVTYYLAFSHAAGLTQDLIYASGNEERNFPLFVFLWSGLKENKDNPEEIRTVMVGKVFHSTNRELGSKTYLELLAMDLDGLREWMLSKTEGPAARAARDLSFFGIIASIFIWIFRDALWGTIQTIFGAGKGGGRRKKSQAEEAAPENLVDDPSPMAFHAKPKKESLPDLDQDPKKRDIIQDMLAKSYIYNADMDEHVYEKKQVDDLCQKFSLIVKNSDGFYYMSDKGIRAYSKKFLNMDAVSYARKRYNDLYEYLSGEGRWDKFFESKKSLLSAFDEAQRLLIRKR